VTKALHEKGIAFILSGLLAYDSQGSDTSLHSPAAKRTERSPFDHFNEVVVLLDELLPKNRGTSKFVSEIPVNTRKSLLQNMVSPQSTPEHTEEEEKPDEIQKMIEENQALLLTLGESIIPPIMHLFASNHNEAVSYRCLTVIGTIINSSNSETLKTMLRQIAFSTFLSNLLSSNDMIFVGCALQMCLLLLNKLPEIFLEYFVREGVVNQAKKIAGREDNKVKRMIDVMKEKVEKALKKAEKEHEKKVEQAIKDEEERLRKEKEEKTGEPVDEEQEKKKKKKKIAEFFQKKKENANQDKKKVEPPTSTEPRPTVSVPFVAPVVTPPVPPEQSRLSNKKCDPTLIKAPELTSYVVALAQKLLEEYYSDSKSQKNDVVAKLKSLATELREADDESTEQDALERIMHALITEEQGVSNYEVLMSGIIHALKQYLTEAEPRTRLRRVCLFAKLFDRPIVEADTQESEDSVDEIDSDSDTGIKIRKRRSSVILSGSPFRNSLGVSPTNSSSLLHMKRGKVEPTYLLELVRRLSSCFTSLENFPLVVNEHVTMLTGIGSVVITMGRAFKIKAQRLTDGVRKQWESQQDQSTPKKKKKQSRNKTETKKDEGEIIQVDVTVTPLTRIHAVERFIQQFEKKRQEQEQAEHYMEESDETNYFEVDENADNEEEQQVNNTTVVAIDRPAEGTNRHEFLQSSVDTSENAEKTVRKYELLINGNVIDPTTCVMNAFYQYEALKAKHPSTIRMNDGEHTIYYREIEEEDAEMDESNPDFVQYAKDKDVNIDLLQTLNRKMDVEKLDVVADEDILDSLELLRLFYILSEKASELPHRVNNLAPLIDSQEFLNTKLSSKIVRQLQDPYMLFSQCLPEWIDKLLYSCPFLFSYDTRRLYYDMTSLGIARAIQKIQERRIRDHNARRAKSHLVRIEKTKIRLAREPNLLQSAFSIFDSHNSHRSVLEFEYFDEEGTGLGPTAEFYSLVSRELQVASLDIWRDSKAIDDNDDRLVSAQELFPRPINSTDTARIARTTRLFEFMGKFVARALMDGRIIDLPFSNSFLRAVRGDRLTFGDLKEIEPVYYKQLDAMRRMVQKKRDIEHEETNEEKRKQLIEALTLNDDGVTTLDVLCQVFVVPGYPDVELVKGGNDKEVTVWNVHEYIELVTSHLLHDGIIRQVQAFRQGYQNMLPVPGIKTWKIFSPAELDDMVCGCNEEIWDEERLAEATRCDHGFSHSSRAVRLLFKVMSEMNTEERRLFVQFITGSPKLPSGGIKNLKPKLTIVLKVAEKGKTPDQYLPSVMTCTNYLKLPDYSSEHVLREQLHKAIRLGQNAFLLS
jgi:E3 ubiquitin-protein ligase TRIP12